MTTLKNKLSKYQYAFNLANDIQDFPRQVIILDKIGNVYREMGNFREANAMFSIALGITHDHNLRYEQGQILVSMGWNFLIAGAISPAVYYNRAALHLGRSVGSLLIQELAWGNLGIAYRILGELDIAIDCHRRSLGLCRDVMKINPDEQYKLDQAKEKANLAHIWVGQQKFEEALQELVEALSTFEALNIPEMIVQTCISLGQVLIEKKEYEESESYLNRGLELAMQEDYLLDQVHIHSFLAEINFLVGEIEKAGIRLSKAKELQHKRLSLNVQRSTLTGNNWTLQIPANVEQVSLSARVAIIESKLKASQGKTAYAKNVLINRIRVAEDYRLSGFESTHQIALFGSQTDVYNELIKLFILDNDFVEAFNYVEQVKSRTLLDELRLSTPILPTNIADSERKRAEELIDIITRSIELCYTGNIATVDDLLLPIPVELTPGNANLHYQAFLARRELNELLETYVTMDNEYALLHGRALSYEQIQRSLPEKTVVVEFFVLDDTIHIFVVSNKWEEPKYRVVSMPVNRFKARYQRVYEREILCRQETLKSGKNIASFRHTWLQLGEELLSPIIEFLDESEIVYLIPHSYLHRLPIHALTLDDRPFIERYAVAYAPSASILAYILNRKQMTSNEQALVISYTESTEEKESFYREAREIATLFEKAVVKLDVEADSEVLCAEAPKAQFIHLLCHAYFNDKNALDSALIIGSTSAHNNDFSSKFSARNWMQLHVTADMLVLNACETGISDIHSGDALLGLVQSLLYAGSRSLVLTLWSVSRPETVAWTKDFYSKFLGRENDPSMAKAFAFQQATLNLRKQNPDPFYWAPFVLIGNWR